MVKRERGKMTGTSTVSGRIWNGFLFAETVFSGYFFLIDGPVIKFNTIWLIGYNYLFPLYPEFHTSRFKNAEYL